MIVAGVLAVIALLVVGSIYLPVNHKILVEGVFDRISEDCEMFSGKKLKVYWFEDYCRECVEGDGPGPMYFECGEAIRSNIKKLTEGEPQKGWSIRIIAHRNIWRQIVSYEWERSAWYPTREAVEKARERIRGIRS